MEPFCNYFTEGIQTGFLVSQRVFRRFPECLESCLRISDRASSKYFKKSQSVQELTEGFQRVFPVSQSVSGMFPECQECCLRISERASSKYFKKFQSVQELTEGFQRMFTVSGEFLECFLSIQRVH